MYVWCMMYAVWCMMYDVWCIAYCIGYDVNWIFVVLLCLINSRLIKWVLVILGFTRWRFLLMGVISLSPGQTKIFVCLKLVIDDELSVSGMKPVNMKRKKPFWICNQRTVQVSCHGNNPCNLNRRAFALPLPLAELCMHCYHVCKFHFQLFLLNQLNHQITSDILNTIVILFRTVLYSFHQ